MPSTPRREKHPTDEFRRQIRWGPLAVVIGILLLLASGSLARLALSEPSGGWWSATQAAVLISVLGWFSWRSASARVVVTPERLVARGVLRTRQVSWADVDAVEVEQPWWLHLVFARTGGGMRVRFVLSQGRSFAPLGCTRQQTSRRSTAL